MIVIVAKGFAKELLENLEGNLVSIISENATIGSFKNKIEQGVIIRLGSVITKNVSNNSVIVNVLGKDNI